MYHSEKVLIDNRPRAPSASNKAAPSYATLNELFTSKEILLFELTADALEIVKTKELRNDASETYRFTLEEIGAACLPLKLFLQYKLEHRKALSNDYLESRSKTLWVHCTLPSLFISRKDAAENYVYKPTEIYDVNLQEKTLMLFCQHYKIVLIHVDNEIIIDDVFESILLGPGEKISFSSLEKAYPGFEERLRAAYAVGLSSEEMVTYSCVEDGSGQFDLDNTNALPAL